MVELKSAGEIEYMREAGRVVARCLAATREQAKPGVTPKELDDLAASIMVEEGAKPAFLNYVPSFASTPYPGVTCISVNDAIVHGIPSAVPLAEGDLVSIDCGAFVQGWCADAAVSFTVGERPSEQDRILLDATERALHAGIAAAVPGARMGDVSAAIGAIGRAGGFGLLAGYGGHGVGRKMHEDPHVPNEGKAGRGMKLKPGLVIAIEPMFNLGGRDTSTLDSDGWTIRTVDGTRAAHFEHTIAVTADGPRILTAL
ncbi:methionine aminopeptidase [Actinorhabdospora filicis]|uniref:Methionine aminopeptidase n=1 Tax=Actinorhabdospora filicis TaxID=1785913 RepID=A0A9W6SEL7_9ACTN|nr:type I methionyl aminopeptidase [Actinorhabdospora filicis]GLZ75794.1 methionine aminopeptidase [Actinorhabdospora filicis]